MERWTNHTSTLLPSVYVMIWQTYMWVSHANHILLHSILVYTILTCHSNKRTILDILNCYTYCTYAFLCACYYSINGLFWRKYFGREYIMSWCLICLSVWFMIFFTLPILFIKHEYVLVWSTSCHDALRVCSVDSDLVHHHDNDSKANMELIPYHGCSI